MKETQVFVVSRADRIGDLILAFPALAYFYLNVKASLPNAKIFLHHSSYTQDVAELALFNGFCDALWEAESPPPFHDKNPYFLSLQHNEKVKKDLKICGQKKSIGPRTKLSTLWTYQKAFVQHRSQVEKSEMEYNVDLTKRALEFWGLPESSPFHFLEPLKLLPHWTAPEKAQEQVVVLSNRGSAGNFSFEQWFEWMVNPGNQRMKTTDFLYYGDHGEEVKSFFEKRMASVPGFRILVNPFQKVSELAVYLKEAKIVYASSTGPLHLAHALGVSVHGVYPSYKSSRVQSFKRWRPHGYAHASPVSYELLE